MLAWLAALRTWLAARFARLVRGRFFWPLIERIERMFCPMKHLPITPPLQIRSPQKISLATLHHPNYSKSMWAKIQTCQAIVNTKLETPDSQKKFPCRGTFYKKQPNFYFSKNFITNWYTVYCKGCAVFYSAKIQIWKQFTTTFLTYSEISSLFFIAQRYKFESNSQHSRSRCSDDRCCFL